MTDSVATKTAELVKNVYSVGKKEVKGYFDVNEVSGATGNDPLAFHTISYPRDFT